MSKVIVLDDDLRIGKKLVAALRCSTFTVVYIDQSKIPLMKPPKPTTHLPLDAINTFRGGSRGKGGKTKYRRE